MSNELDDFQKQLELLKQTYKLQLPEKIKNIDEAYKLLQNNEWKVESLKNLQHLVHGLAGSGATFGFTSLSTVSRELDIYLQSIVKNAIPPTNEQKSKIESLIIAIKHTANLFDESISTYNNQSRIESKKTISRYEKKDKLIFVVDDDPILLNDLSLQISHFGYDVQSFSKIDDFKSAIKESLPSVVVMDVSFSENDKAGIEAIKEIKNQNETPINVVFTSVRKDFISRLEAVRAGGSAYFPKPIDISELIDIIDTLTSSKENEPYRILIVEDEKELSSYYSLILQNAGMETLVVNDPYNVMESLENFRPELILMDIYMPGCNGLELASVIRQQSLYVGIPIVFLSVETNLEKQIFAMKLGGDDFLTKPIEPNRLISSISVRAERYRILRSFMIKDSLTGLLNHTTVMENLEMNVALAKRRNSKLSFAMIDLDKFKLVNDTYGHSTGDRVLKNLSRLLQQRLRKTDIVGRCGGEEFAVILPDTDVYDAYRVLDEIRVGFSMIRQQSENAEFNSTFSCGIAGFPQYDSAVKICNSADEALYQAKNNGRNQVVIATK